MTDYEKLLSMIEGVDPDDTAKCDHICDAFWEWCGGRPKHKIFWDVVHSRDALKDIRPDGWYPSIHRTPRGNFYGDDQYGDCPTPALPTEELAELHAIIQAIEWERKNDR